MVDRVNIRHVRPFSVAEGNNHPQGAAEHHEGVRSTLARSLWIQIRKGKLTTYYDFEAFVRWT
jgi:hypothetical protein